MTLRIKHCNLLLPLCFIGALCNASALIYSGVATINTVNHPGFDFIAQSACSTITTYSGCYQNFYIYGGGPRTDLESNNGYVVKMGKVNLDSLKTAPAASVFALTPLWIDQIPFDSLQFRVGNIYWIKTGPENGLILYAKIRILSFPIMDSIKPETAMTFLYALDPTGGHNATTTGLDTFFKTPTSVLSPGTSLNHKPSGFSSSSLGQLVFKVAGDRFMLPEDLAGTSGFISVFNLAGKRLGRVPFDGKTREVNLEGMGRGAVVVRVER
jgi:hypothetical protein